MSVLAPAITLGFVFTFPSLARLDFRVFRSGGLCGAGQELSLIWDVCGSVKLLFHIMIWLACLGILSHAYMYPEPSVCHAFHLESMSKVSGVFGVMWACYSWKLLNIYCTSGESGNYFHAGVFCYNCVSLSMTHVAVSADRFGSNTRLL